MPRQLVLAAQRRVGHLEEVAPEIETRHRPELVLRRPLLREDHRLPVEERVEAEAPPERIHDRHVRRIGLHGVDRERAPLFGRAALVGGPPGAILDPAQERRERHGGLRHLDRRREPWILEGQAQAGRVLRPAGDAVLERGEEVVDPVVEDHEVGDELPLQRQHQGDHSLRAHVAELAEVGHLDPRVGHPVGQPLCEIGWDGELVPGAHAP